MAPERGVAVTIDGGPGRAEVWTILEAADGSIWIGARDGLYAAQFSTEPGPASGVRPMNPTSSFSCRIAPARRGLARATPSAA